MRCKERGQGQSAFCGGSDVGVGRGAKREILLEAAPQEIYKMKNHWSDPGCSEL